MRLFNIILTIFLSAGLLSHSYAAPSKDPFNTDKFLRTINLKKLLDTNTPVNLIAQLNTPTGSTSNVNDMSDFFGIANIDTGSIITEFDRSQDILQQNRFPEPWVGVSKFKQTQIPLMTLQKGFEEMQACLAQKNQPIPNKLSRLVIYRTLNTSQIVYDYLVPDDDYPADMCREVLFTPATHDCQYGMVDDCHLDMLNVAEHIKK